MDRITIGDWVAGTLFGGIYGALPDFARSLTGWVRAPFWLGIGTEIALYCVARFG